MPFDFLKRRKSDGGAPNTSGTASRGSRDRGIPFDTIGTMSISAALFALVAAHGQETTAEFVRDLVDIIRSGEFNLPIATH